MMPPLLHYGVTLEGLRQHPVQRPFTIFRGTPEHRIATGSYALILFDIGDEALITRWISLN